MRRRSSDTSRSSGKPGERPPSWMDFDAVPAPMAAVKSMRRRFSISESLGPRRGKSTPELRLQALNLDPIRVGKQPNDAGTSGMSLNVNAMSQSSSSTNISKVFARSLNSRGRALANMSSNSGPSSSDTWETEYKGGRIVITRSGLSVLPRRGNPSYVKERWWHPGVLQVDEMRTLGRGACSVVHPARLVHEGLERPCAVKVFNLLDEEQQRQLSQEIQILVRSHEERCTALVRFLGAYQRPEGKVSIVLEYMDRGSLQDLIFRERSRLNSSGCGDGGLMPERVVASIAFQALQGLAHLHERCCMHRDIKPSNLLINSKGELKLTDFGILKELSSKHATIDAVTGTVKYMAPERLRGEPYGLAADIWSFGLVLLECASQHPFWNSSGQVEMLQLLEEQGSKGLISAGRGHLSKRFVDVIARTLDMDATKRADAEAALRLPWFVVQGVSSQRSAMTVLSLYLTKAASLADDALRKAAATTAAAAGTEALDAAAASTSMQRFSSPHITSPLTAPQSGAASPACSLHSVPSPASLKPAASVSPVSPRSAATAATEGLNTPPPMQGAHSISSV